MDEHRAERLTITQDMTIYHAETLKNELLQTLRQHPLIELDLSQVGEIDTAGIQLLMLIKNESQRLDKTVRIIAHSPAVQELIDFFRIAGFFGDPLIIPANSASA